MVESQLSQFLRFELIVTIRISNDLLALSWQHGAESLKPVHMHVADGSGLFGFHWPTRWAFPRAQVVIVDGDVPKFAAEASVVP